MIKLDTRKQYSAPLCPEGMSSGRYALIEGVSYLTVRSYQNKPVSKGLLELLAQARHTGPTSVSLPSLPMELSPTSTRWGELVRIQISTWRIVAVWRRRSGRALLFEGEKAEKNCSDS